VKHPLYNEYPLGSIVVVFYEPDHCGCLPPAMMEKITVDGCVITAVLCKKCYRCREDDKDETAG
jgi:hypothetical protein